MIRYLPITFAALGLIGCMFQGPLPQVPIPQASVPGTVAPFFDQKSVLSPSSLPLVPLVGPAGITYDEKLLAMRQQVLDSRAEVDAYLANQGQAGAEPQPLPAAITTLDFARYQVVAWCLSDWMHHEARIVGIEEQADRRVVHTVRWPAMLMMLPSPGPRATLHMVAVPRSDKPIGFAQILSIPLATPVIAPSPQVGVASRPAATPSPDNTQARWRPVPNPELSAATFEAAARHEFPELAIDSVTVERRTIEWVEENVESGLPTHWLPGTEVWVARLVGTPTREPAPGHPRERIGGAPEHHITMLFAVDTGDLIMKAGH
jgi:hypothetical protein